jgi:hypothetical protein
MVSYPVVYLLREAAPHLPERLADSSSPGCLTCRRRKVRCLGGNPCLNCSRMRIACESSFDNNLRIRVSTPTGQRDLSSRPVSPAGQSGHSHAQPSTAGVTSTPRTVPGGSVYSAADSTPVRLAHHDATCDPGEANLQPPFANPCVWSQGPGNLDCSSSVGVWAPPSGLPVEDLSLQYAFFPGARDQAAHPFTYPATYLGLSAMALSGFPHNQAIFGCEPAASTTDRQNHQDATGFNGWWTPTPHDADGRADNYDRVW